MHFRMDRRECVRCIICIFLVVMAPVKATKTSESCYIPQSTQNCSYHRLECADGEKVQINETFYVEKSARLNCHEEVLSCPSKEYTNCCTTDGENHIFNTTELESIKTLCSNKAYCKFPAPRRQNLIMSVVTYECIQGKTTGIAVGITVAVVAISGILIAIMCYLKRGSKRSFLQNRTRLNSALSPLYNEVMDVQSFPPQTASYEYATLEDIQGGGPDPEPVVGGYDHLGVVARGIDARGVGLHYDTAVCAMPFSQQEKADRERDKEESTTYNHLNVKPQKSKVLHNPYDVAMQKPNL